MWEDIYKKLLDCCDVFVPSCEIELLDLKDLAISKNQERGLFRLLTVTCVCRVKLFKMTVLYDVYTCTHSKQKHNTILT